MTFKIKKYDSGLSLITAPVKGTKTATILIMVGTGSKYETKENNGISHFLEHAIFKGTKRRPSPKTIVNELDSLGCDYNAFTGKEYTGYWIKIDSSKLKKAIDILGDMFLNSKFNFSEISREKGVIIEELNMYLDNPMYYIEDMFEECVFGVDTPAGRDTIGTKENILGFIRKDFVDYFESQYGPSNTSIIVSGNIDEKKVEKDLSTIIKSNVFNSRGKNFQEKEVVVLNQEKAQIKVKEKKTDQAHLSLGVLAPGYGDKDSYALKLISVILGGSMSSRLFMNLREKNGLAYYVRTGHDAYTDSGYMTTQAGVPVDKVEKAIEIIISEYRKLTKALVGSEELKKAKDLMAGKIAIQLESSDNVANWYARQSVMLNAIARKDTKIRKIVNPDENIKALKKVTANDIRRVARDIFKTSKLNLAVIGPYKDDKKFRRLLKI